MEYQSRRRCNESSPGDNLAYLPPNTRISACLVPSDVPLRSRHLRFTCSRRDSASMIWRLRCPPTDQCSAIFSSSGIVFSGLLLPFPALVRAQEFLRSIIYLEFRVQTFLKLTILWMRFGSTGQFSCCWRTWPVSYLCEKIFTNPSAIHRS